VRPIPAIRGVIKRRILVNYRVEPAGLHGLVPAPFKVRLVDGYAMAGVCLIRLERVRPSALPGPNVGLASDNVAYRIAVEWDDPEAREQRQGVYIPRRDTSLSLQRAFGGRFFPGDYHHSRFTASDHDGRIAITVRSEDGGGDVELDASEGDAFPEDSVFGSLADASHFFEEGSVGYSAKQQDDRLDGLLLQTESWAVRPLAVHEARSSFFERIGTLAPGSVSFDNTLIMRNVPHEWHALPQLSSEAHWEGRMEHTAGERGVHQCMRRAHAARSESRASRPGAPYALDQKDKTSCC